MTVPGVHDIYRLSYMQEGLLFHSVADPQAAFYVDQVEYRLHGPVDAALLVAAWQKLTERHAVLRTSFHWEDIKQPVQVVRDRVEVPLEELDWRDQPADELAGRLEQRLRADRLEGFDVDRPPLIRLTLIRLGEQEYVFVLRYHHLLLDAWSALMVLEEAFAGYDELAAGRTPQARPATPFADYVAWVRAQDLNQAEKTWRDELRGVTEPSTLPWIRPVAAPPATNEPEEKGYPEKKGYPEEKDNPEQVLHIPAETVTALREVCRTGQVAFGALLQTCWALVLRAHTGRDDVVFGGTLSSRPADVPGVEESAGLFINTLPVRVRLNPSVPVLDAAGTLQHRQATLRRYDFSPLEQVQRWSDVPPGVPLFDTIMTVLNVPGVGVLRRRRGAVEISDGQYRYRTNYPLSVLVIPDGDRLAVRFGYDPGRVGHDAVTRLLGHFATVVGAVAREPGAAVRDVPVIPASEQARVGGWAGEDEPYPAATFPQLFEERADADGDAVAVRCGGMELTYAEVDRQANQLARHLREQGVCADVAVGVCLGRTPEWVVAALAAQKAGGYFVALDPAHPPARLRDIVADAGIAVVVTDRAHRSPLPRDGVPAVLLDQHRAAIAGLSEDRLPPRSGPDHLAYSIYTSGSTGRPKGVLVTHRGLANVVAAQRRLFGLTAEDRVLQWASPTFDASVFDLAMAFGAGAALHLAPAERLAPGPDLRDLLVTERITQLTITPSALAATPAARLPELRTLVLAGEALAAELVRAWSPGRRVFNAYGPTEATIWVSTAECGPGEGPPPIGVPIPNVRVRVLDRDGRAAGIGMPGELHVGGAGLARGYAGRAALTAQQFVPDPDGPPGSRLYRTGDLVSWTADGSLRFVGRTDRQVKVRGLRIETGEVEEVLRRHAGVAACAVVARDAEDRDGPPDTLVAYVVPAAGPVSADELRRHCAEVLPEYMLPGAFVSLDRLPLTSAGKLDVRALPSPRQAAPGGGPEQPMTVTEQAVADLWRQVLRVDDVGADSDFFTLGGTSIKATQVVSRARRAWQVDMPIRAVFENRTVSAFAAELERVLADEIDEDEQEVRDGDDQGVGAARG
ncbi:amino acid adenylation domain-containing protein [Actinoplanes sp. NPDC023936]|uniref:non-ribosomal peptide synthetase n=1 Tax=Actinoplanes sp. NPDC023936 TaxID=3154910 RepID=UPI0033E210B7